MVIMALDKWLKMGEENTPRCASKWTKITYGEEFKDHVLLRETEQAERIFPNHNPFQIALNNSNERKFPVDIEEKSMEEKNIPSSDGVPDKTVSKDLTIQEQTTHISKKSESNSIGGMTGDYLSGDFNRRKKETEIIPFEHIHVQTNEVSPSEKMRSESKSIEIVNTDKFENAKANNDLSKNTDEEIFFSNQLKVNFIQSTFVPDKETNKVYTDEKPDDVVPCETQIHLNQDKREYKARNNFSPKNIFKKLANWAFDEVFYTGVINSGSFINKLSKNLTG